VADPLWTSAEIAAATGGKANAAFACTGVSIDSRSIEPGDLFVALAGERDGHEFLAGAYQRGAAGALISKPFDKPSVLVDDTFTALEALGLAARMRAAKARRCAVTGSVGKTSLTQAIAAGIAKAGPSHTSVKSYNNHIGVPLTLARMPAGTERAVFEMGMNHAGEIGPLSKLVQPHVALITTVGPVHMEAFPDGVEGIARAKAEVFEGMAPGGLAILNADDGWGGLLAGEARKRGLEIASFGTAKGVDAQLLNFQPDGDGAVIRARLHTGDFAFRIGQTAPHWGLNGLAALLALEALGVPLEMAAEALAEYRPLAGRGASRALTVAGGPILLIDESYNANPVSMRAALRALAARPGRKVAVLTDMLELGPEAASWHAGLAEPIAEAGVDRVFLAGPLMKSLWEALPAERRGAWAENADKLAPMVLDALESGDTVMVKGSNGSAAGRVVKAIEAGALETAGEGR
jgi:UDP-N-acetylmuramoyl-tripeptide--D-alanyl-D-alanine ligase